MPIFGRLLRFMIAHQLRGSTRLLDVMSRTKTYRLMPIRSGDSPAVYLDLTLDHQGLLSSKTLEPHICSVLQVAVRPGDVVFDIGANLGIHTVRLAQLVGNDGRVEVFEPNPLLHAPLERTVAQLPNATLHRMALSNENAVVRFCVPVDHSMAGMRSSDGKFPEHLAVAHEFECKASRLDDLDLPQPALLKVDVEGAERLVFEGAERILGTADAPMVIFEENAYAATALGYAQTAALEFLRTLTAPGFEFFMVERPSGRLRSLPPERSGWVDIVALPVRRRHRLAPLIAE